MLCQVKVGREPVSTLGDGIGKFEMVAEETADQSVWTELKTDLCANPPDAGASKWRVRITHLLN